MPRLLAAALVEFLTPTLPYLLGLGGKAAEEAAKESGKAGAKKLWAKLRPKVEEKEAAKEAAEDLAEEPADEDARAAFRRQVKKLLEGDEDLAAEVAALLEESGALARYQARVEGSGAIA